MQLLQKRESGIRPEKRWNAAGCLESATEVTEHDDHDSTRGAPCLLRARELPATAWQRHLFEV